VNKHSNSWFPSCVVIMTIRYDESLQVAGTGEAITVKSINAVTQESRIRASIGTVTATQYPLFPEEGPAYYSRALAYNRKHAVDPPWFTVLSSTDETAFRAWVKTNRVPFDVHAAIVDYDMRGYWLDFIKPGGVWTAGHFPDTWKTPYDTTFSAESKYAVAGCPLQWSGERLFNTETGQLVFGDPITRTVEQTGPAKRPRRGLTEHTATVGKATAEPLVGQQNEALSKLDDYRPNDVSQSETPGANAVTSSGGPRTNSAPNSETVPLTFGTDGFTVIANRVPKKGSFTLPHPRSAATFTLSIDYKEFPVDPGIIRAVGLEIHVGTVSAEDFARGMNGETDSNGRPLSILKTTNDVVDPTTKRYGPNQATLLFHATADTWEVEHGEKGSFVTIVGRDIRGIFIDAKVPLAKIAAIDLTKPINQVVEAIIKTMGVDQDLRMSVMTDAAEWPNGRVPSPGDVGGLTRVRLGSSGDKTSSTPASGTKTSYWDLITNYCTLVGAMPSIVGSVLWIRPNRRIFDIVDRRSSIATPFAGGQPREVGQEKIRARRLVYGRDVKRLRFERKFAGAVVPAIQCISFDDTAKGGQRLIFGQWPPETSSVAKAKSEQELMRIPMWGIRSTDQLTQIAHGIYEEIGRGETGGTAETNNLASFGGDNGDPDLLRLRPLEPVEFVVDSTALRTVAPVVAELVESERRTFAEEVDILHRRLGDRAVARALVALARGAVRELISFYQVIGVQYDWDNGIKVSMQFQNYIVPRHNAKAAGDVQRKPDLRHSRISVPGAHKKSKVTTTVGKPSAVPWQAEPSFDGDGQGSYASPPPPESGGLVLRHRYRRLGDKQ
jgi:hypothetical protein